MRGSLPEGVNPVIGPDATGVGWVYEYAITDETGQHNLAELRSLQERLVLGLSQGQHAPVELQPRQLPVYVARFVGRRRSRLGVWPGDVIDLEGMPVPEGIGRRSLRLRSPRHSPYATAPGRGRC